MGYAKVDTQILDSSLWLGSDEMKLVFVTALLMARPKRFDEPVRQIAMDSLDETGYEAPPDEYGFVAAAGAAIVARSGVEDSAAGMEGLVRLCLPEPNSRSVEFEGRRMMRVQGGFLVLNMMRFRNYDYTEADRQKRAREKRKAASAKRATKRVGGHARDAHRDEPVTVTQPYTINHSPSTNETKDTPSPSAPEVGVTKRTKKPNAPELYGDPLFVEFWNGYPNKTAKGQAWATWLKMVPADREMAARKAPIFCAAYEKADDERRQFIPHPSTWLNDRRYEDDPAVWYVKAGTTPPPKKPKRDFAKEIRDLEAVIERMVGEMRQNERECAEMEFAGTLTEQGRANYAMFKENDIDRIRQTRGELEALKQEAARG